MNFCWSPEADKAFLEVEGVIRLSAHFCFTQSLLPVFCGGGCFRYWGRHGAPPSLPAHMVGFSPVLFSHRFLPSEQNYGVAERKLLVVKLTLEEWRHHLEGTELSFIVWTNHKNLIYISS